MKIHEYIFNKIPTAFNPVRKEWLCKQTPWVLMLASKNKCCLCNSQSWIVYHALCAQHSSNDEIWMYCQDKHIPYHLSLDVGKDVKLT